MKRTTDAVLITSKSVLQGGQAPLCQPQSASATSYTLSHKSCFDVLFRWHGFEPLNFYKAREDEAFGPSCFLKFDQTDLTANGRGTNTEKRTGLAAWLKTVPDPPVSLKLGRLLAARPLRDLTTPGLLPTAFQEPRHAESRQALPPDVLGWPPNQSSQAGR